MDGLAQHARQDRHLQLEELVGEPEDGQRPDRGIAQDDLVEMPGGGVPVERRLHVQRQQLADPGDRLQEGGGGRLRLLDAGSLEIRVDQLGVTHLPVGPPVAECRFALGEQEPGDLAGELGDVILHLLLRGEHGADESGEEQLAEVADEGGDLPVGRGDHPAGTSDGGVRADRAEELRHQLGMRGQSLSLQWRGNGSGDSGSLIGDTPGVAGEKPGEEPESGIRTVERVAA